MKVTKKYRVEAIAKSGLINAIYVKDPIQDIWFKPIDGQELKVGDPVEISIRMGGDLNDA